MNLVSNSSTSSTSSRLIISYEDPLTIDLSITPIWKRNNVSEESKKLYNTEGVEYATIETIDTNGLVVDYRISRNVWQKCIDSNRNVVYPAIDESLERDNIQLILPSTGSPTVLARLAALKAKRQQSLLQPKGDESLPF
jgi:hypothetical protein